MSPENQLKSIKSYYLNSSWTKFYHNTNTGYFQISNQNLIKRKAFDMKVNKISTGFLSLIQLRKSIN